MYSPLAPSVAFTPVDPKLIRINRLIDLMLSIPLIVGLVALSLTVWSNHPWTWVFPVLIAAVTAWDMVMDPRRVRATGYAELTDELVIAKGIMFRKVEVIPYGRMQQVTVSAGPLLHRYGLAKVKLVTASAGTDSEIPAVPRDEAERLRVKLTALGEANMEGL
ncbi:MAG: PH domain-containing protein [Ancrocorticia sp.]